MSISVATWNIGEGLGHTDRSSKITEAVKQLDADVVMLSDAYWVGNPQHPSVNDPDQAEIAKEAFNKAGYSCYEVSYHKPRGQWGGRYALALSRIEGEFSSVTPGSSSLANEASSYAARLTIDPKGDLPLQILGVHLDDQSEEVRTVQAQSLAVDMKRSSKVLMGTLYSMDSGRLKNELLGSRIARGLASLQPSQKSRNAYEKRRGRKTNLARLTDMAQGKALATLTRSGLYDADASGAATFESGKLVATKLDYIMLSFDLEAEDFRVHDATDLTRHKAISARIAPLALPRFREL